MNRVEFLRKKGVSLIVLVITIVVVVIITTAILSVIVNGSVITNAKETTLRTDIAAFQSELDVYKNSKYAESVGDFDPDSLNANIAGQVEYNDEVSKNEDIYDILPSLKGSSWDGKVYIKDGILFFDGLSDKEQEIADDVTKKDD